MSKGLKFFMHHHHDIKKIIKAKGLSVKAKWNQERVVLLVKDASAEQRQAIEEQLTALWRESEVSRSIPITMVSMVAENEEADFVGLEKLVQTYHAQQQSIKERKLKKLYKQEIRSLIDLGKAYYARGKNKEAQNQYEQALNLTQHLGEQGQCWEAKLHFYLGKIHVRLNECKEGLDCFKKSREIAATSLQKISTAIWMGIAYYKKGEHENSFASHNEALQYCLHELSDQNEQSQARTRLLRRKMAKVLSHLGTIYLHKSEYEQALAYQQRALSLAKEVYGIKHQTVAWISQNIATIYMRMDNIDEAIEGLQLALKIRQQILPSEHPVIARNYNTLAESYIKRWQAGDDEKALDCLAQVKVINQTHQQEDHRDILAASYKCLGQVYLKKHDYKQAILEFNRALSIDKEKGNHRYIAEGHYNLGSVHFAAACYKEASEEYKQALNMYVDNEGRREFHERYQYQLYLARSYLAALAKEGMAAEGASEQLDQACQLLEELQHLNQKNIEQELEQKTRGEEVQPYTIYDFIDYGEILNLLAQSYALKKQPARAAALYWQQACKVQTLFPVLALHWIDQGLKVLHGTREANKLLADLYYLRSQISYQQKRYRYALESIKKALQIEEGNKSQSRYSEWQSKQAKYSKKLNDLLSIVDEDLYAQLERAQTTYLHLQERYFIDLSQGKKLSEHAKNRTTELLIKLRNLLDMAFRRLVVETILEPNQAQEKQEPGQKKKKLPDIYYPIESSLPVFRKHLRTRKMIQICEVKEKEKQTKKEKQKGKEGKDLVFIFGNALRDLYSLLKKLGYIDEKDKVTSKALEEIEKADGFADLDEKFTFYVRFLREDLKNNKENTVWSKKNLNAIECKVKAFILDSKFILDRLLAHDYLEKIEEGSSEESSAKKKEKEYIYTLSERFFQLRAEETIDLSLPHDGYSYSRVLMLNEEDTPPTNIKNDTLVMQKKGCIRILMLPDNAVQQTNIEQNTIVMQKSNGYLAAYWNEKGKIINKSIEEKEVTDIVEVLPEAGKVSKDNSLIKKITSKYGYIQDGALIAYWGNENGKGVDKFLKYEEVTEIIDALPKEGESSNDKDLIDHITSKYDCHPLGLRLAFHAPMIRRRLDQIWQRASHVYSLDAGDYRQAYTCILEQQPFWYYKEANNQERNGFWKKSWLEKLNAIQNESKHVRLTPQDLESEVKKQRGNITRRQVRINIEYLDTRFYGWSLVDDLLKADSSLSDNAAIDLSRQMIKFLKQDRVFAGGTCRYIDNQVVKHPLIKDIIHYKQLSKQLGDNEQGQVYVLRLEKAKQAFKAQLAQDIKEHKPEWQVYVELIAEQLIRKGLQRGRVQLDPDLRVDAPWLIETALQEVNGLVSVLGLVRAEAKKKLGSTSTASSRALVKEEQLAKRVLFARQNKIPAISKSLKSHFQEEMSLSALEKAHRDLGHAAYAYSLAGKWYNAGKLYYHAATTVAENYPWLALVYYQKALIHYGYSPKGLKKLSRVAKASAKLAYEQKLWPQALKDLQMAIKEWRGPAKKRLALRNLLASWQAQEAKHHTQIDTDLAGQLSHCRENYMRALYLSFRLYAQPEHEYLLHQLQNIVGEMIIKLRHLLDQGLGRFILAIIQQDPDYRQLIINIWDAKFPCKGTEASMRRELLQDLEQQDKVFAERVKEFLGKDEPFCALEQKLKEISNKKSKPPKELTEQKKELEKKLKASMRIHPLLYDERYQAVYEAIKATQPFNATQQLWLQQLQLISNFAKHVKFTYPGKESLQRYKQGANRIEDFYPICYPENRIYDWSFSHILAGNLSLSTQLNDYLHQHGFTTKEGSLSEEGSGPVDGLKVLVQIQSAEEREIALAQFNQQFYQKLQKEQALADITREQSLGIVNKLLHFAERQQGQFKEDTAEWVSAFPLLAQASQGVEQMLSVFFEHIYPILLPTSPLVQEQEMLRGKSQEKTRDRLNRLEQAVKTESLGYGLRLFSVLQPSQHFARALFFPKTEQAKKWLAFGYHTEGKAPVTRINEKSLEIELIGEDLGESRQIVLEEFAAYLKEAIGIEHIKRLEVSGHHLYLDLYSKKQTDAVITLLQSHDFAIYNLPPLVDEETVPVTGEKTHAFRN